MLINMVTNLGLGFKSVPWIANDDYILLYVDVVLAIVVVLLAGVVLSVFVTLRSCISNNNKQLKLT